MASRSGEAGVLSELDERADDAFYWVQAFEKESEGASRSRAGGGVFGLAH